MSADTQSSTAVSDVIIVLTTLPAEADAEAFAEALVTERLAACVSIGGPMTSVYTWQGALERARERQVVMKTVRARLPLIEARLAALHPYEVPELLALPVADGGAAYLAWVRESAAG
jgi:periplasmic divalent cation tolerance protein